MDNDVGDDATDVTVVSDQLSVVSGREERSVGAPLAAPANGTTKHDNALVGDGVLDVPPYGKAKHDNALVGDGAPDVPPDVKALASSKKRAVKILGNRQMSTREVEKRLVNKGEAEETARKTVEWLEDIGAINDEQYAEAIVRHYCAKGYGLARIKDELFRRGIPREMWEDAIAGVTDFEDSAIRFLEKKLGGSSDKNELRRAEGALLRRGFSYEEARAAVRRYLEELGDEVEV